MRKLFGRGIVAVGAMALVLTGIAVATPGSGVISAPILARGGFVDRVDMKVKTSHHGQDAVVNVKDAADTVVQQVQLDAGGQTGWHSHPGPAIVVVKSGSFTLYEGDDPTCTGHTFTAGQAFVDPGQGNVHLGRNESNVVTELFVTYFDVPPGGSPRLDAPDPGNCPF
jgi:quercetin dioxygenase-like cupin family protein